MTAVMDLIGATLTLSTPGEVSDTRRKVRGHAAEAITDTSRLDDLELLASEAITNALIHGTPPITVTVTIDLGTVRVEVRDQGHQPGAGAWNGRADHGRGLDIIAQLASRWSLIGDQGCTVLMFEIDR